MICEYFKDLAPWVLERINYNLKKNLRNNTGFAPRASLDCAASKMAIPLNADLDSLHFFAEYEEYISPIVTVRFGSDGHEGRKFKKNCQSHTIFYFFDCDRHLSRL